MSEHYDDSSRESDGDNDQSKGGQSTDSNTIDELLWDLKMKEFILVKLGLNDDPKDPVPTWKDRGRVVAGENDFMV